MGLVDQAKLRANPMKLVAPTKPQGWGTGDEFWEYCVDVPGGLPYPNGYAQWGVCADVQYRQYFGAAIEITVRRNGLKNGKWYTCTWRREEGGQGQLPDPNWELDSCTLVPGGGNAKHLQHPGGGYYQEPKDEPAIPRLSLANPPAPVNLRSGAVWRNPLPIAGQVQPQGYGIGDEFWVHALDASDYNFPDHNWSSLTNMTNGYTSWGSTMDVQFRCDSWGGCDEYNTSFGSGNAHAIKVRRNGSKNGKWYTCTWDIEVSADPQLVSCVELQGGGGAKQYQYSGGGFYQEPKDEPYDPWGRPIRLKVNPAGPVNVRSGAAWRNYGSYNNRYYGGGPTYGPLSSGRYNWYVHPTIPATRQAVAALLPPGTLGGMPNIRPALAAMLPIGTFNRRAPVRRVSALLQQNPAGRSSTDNFAEARMAASSPNPTGWLPATFFDAPPSASSRRWVKLLAQGTGGVGLFPPINQPGETYYTAILYTQFGQQQKYVAVRVRSVGTGSVEAMVYADMPAGWDPDTAPQPVDWPPDGLPPPGGVPTQPNTDAWIPATFFDTPPSALTRRWVQLTSEINSVPPHLPPGAWPTFNDESMYNGILFTNWGAQQQNVIVRVRQVGNSVEANLHIWESFEPVPTSPLRRSGYAAGQAAGYVSNPEPLPWQEVHWLPATYFDGPPSPNLRRWVKLLSPISPWGGTQGPGIVGDGTQGIPIPLYNAILFKQWGASQENVVVSIRTIPTSGGGSRVEASVTPLQLPQDLPPQRRGSYGAGLASGYVSNPGFPATRRNSRGSGGSFSGGGFHQGGM